MNTSFMSEGAITLLQGPKSTKTNKTDNNKNAHRRLSSIIRFKNLAKRNGAVCPTVPYLLVVCRR